MANISYSAVVLDEKSKEKLINYFKSIIPIDFEIIADHQTINIGEIDPEFKQYLNLPVKIHVIKLGISEKAIAVETTGFPTKNKIPHITIAIDRKNGAKPKDSNQIINWNRIKHPLVLFGKVKEVEY